MRRVVHPALPSRLHFAQALQARPFALLWTGQTISVLGDAVFTIAITWEVLLLTGSATAMSLIVIAQWAPKIVLLLFGGVLANQKLPVKPLSFRHGDRRAFLVGRDGSGE
jgi:hypothetical protein